VPSVGDAIDLDPAVVRVVSKENGHVTITFNRQPCYSRGVGENPRLVPLFNCKVYILNGRIELMNVQLPLETSDWEVFFSGGSRRFFLPTDFDALGPVRFVLGPKQSPRIVVAGDRVTMELGEQVGTVEHGLAP